MGLYLKPTEIRYTQETIGTVFRQKTKHKNTQIGRTLDELLVASSSVDQIPKITVFQKNGKWYSFDNRRLWIFKKLEEYGKCSKVLVEKSQRFQYRKFTTKSDGTSVKLRGGDPGGTYWRQQEELLKSHHSDPHDKTTATIQESTSHVRKETTAELHNESKNTETIRTPSSASLTTMLVHGDGAEHLSDLKLNTSSRPSSAVLDLYFSVMLDSSWTSKRNGLDKADTKVKIPETSDGSDSTFNDSHKNETHTLPVSPEKSDDDSDSTLHDSDNDVTVALPVSPDDVSDSTFTDSHTLPLSPETRVYDSDSTQYDSYSPETSSTDTTPTSPVLTELIADMDSLGLRLADLGLSFLSAVCSASTVRSTTENQTPTPRPSSEYEGKKKKKKRKKRKK